MSELQLFPHQFEFVSDIAHRYIALRAGLGAGKSFAFCAKAIHLAAINCEAIGSHVAIICEPTYPLIADVLIPSMEEVLAFAGITQYELTKTGGTPEFKIKFAAGTCTMKMRSAENFRRLVGINAAWAGIDEMDTMDSKVQEEMWVRVNARVRRKGAIKQTFVTSTPEGHKFMNEFFVEKAVRDPEHAKRVRVIQASSYDNPEIEDEVHKANIANMTEEQVQAWILGNAVNMTTGRIYRKFTRTDNNSELTVEKLLQDNETVRDSRGNKLPLPPLHIGMDFNIDKMAAVTHVETKEGVVAVDELIGLADTEQMIRVIKERYPQFKINIYPDSSGKSRHTNASGETDIKLLQRAGFTVLFESTNGSVRDRINCMNVAFCNAEGVRKYRVNVRKCPQYVQGLERQVYDKNSGEPLKDGKFDHANDAAGYYIMKKFPIKHIHQGGLRLVGMY